MSCGITTLTRLAKAFVTNLSNILHREIGQNWLRVSELAPFINRQMIDSFR